MSKYVPHRPQDEDPYVRKTAAVCVAKLYDISPDMVEDRGFLDTLRVGGSEGFFYASPYFLRAVCGTSPPDIVEDRGFLDTLRVGGCGGNAKK